MEDFGRLIRTSDNRGTRKAVAYIVALSDATQAIELIRSKVGAPDDTVEDMGRVSEELLKALRLRPGGFVRADGRPVQT
jgi:hypothetical protein